MLRLLAEGLTAESIGRRLGVSRHTVRKHLEHVYRKLGVTDRLVAVREARAQGLLEEPFEERTGG
jgi:DNA-binding CsgD family transcriptional regulator